MSLPKLSRTGVFDFVSDVFLGMLPKPLTPSSGSSSVVSPGSSDLDSSLTGSSLFKNNLFSHDAFLYIRNRWQVVHDIEHGFFDQKI
jgi:hypothetical protein